MSRKECDKVFPNCHIAMFVGSSVSWKECDEVFLNCHICSLDRHGHGNNVTKFSRVAIYGR